MNFITWLLITIASLSYPTFLFYIPIFIIISIIKIIEINKLYKDFKRYAAMNLLIGFIAIATPFLLISVYLEKPGDFYFNPHFLRGGGAVNMARNSLRLLFNIFNGSSRTQKELFFRRDSYYYDVKKVEFSWLFTRLAVLAIVLINIHIYKNYKSYRLAQNLSLLLLIITLFFSNISSWVPGLRRVTPVIIAIYAFYILGLQYLLASKYRKSKIISVVSLCFLTSILLHHLFVVPANINYLINSSLDKETACFNIVRNSPNESIAFMAKLATNGHTYNEIISRYKTKDNDCLPWLVKSGIIGYCYWNKANCVLPSQ